jgi:hypothetical protein
MRLIDVEFRTTSEHACLIGRVACGEPRREVEISFEFPRRYEAFVSRTADAFPIALLVPSMAAGEPLEIVPPVSESLLFNLAGIRDIFHTWYPQFQRVAIDAKPRIDPRRPIVAQAATFFSGGVDSLYTLLKRLYHDPLPAPLTHMIFMHGIEQELGDSKGADQSQQRAEQIAATVGVECIVGKTNLRTLFPLHWERYYFGSGLAATAVALSGGLGYACIPSSFTYRHQVPHGSTPLVDERFSTEAIRIVHDGGEASRAVKTARILEWNPPLVLQNLRVCIENAGGDFNCGKCYKCVRTGVALKAMGLWEQASTFPDKSTSHWDKVISDDHPVLTEENLDLARERGIDRELIARLERIVRKRRRLDGFATFVKSSPLEHLLPIFRRARRWAGGKPRMH